MISVIYFNTYLREVSGYDPSFLLDLAPEIVAWFDVGANPIPAKISTELTNYQWDASDSVWGVIPETVIQAITTPYILILDKLTRIDSKYIHSALRNLEHNPQLSMIGGRGEEDLQDNYAPAWFGRWKHIFHTGTSNIESGELQNFKHLFTPGQMVRAELWQLISKIIPEKKSFSIEFLQDAITRVNGKPYYDSSLVFQRYIPNELLTVEVNKEIGGILYHRQAEFGQTAFFQTWSSLSFFQKLQFTLATFLFKKVIGKTRKEIIHLWLSNFPLMKKTDSFRSRLINYLRTKHHFPQKINLFIVGEQKCGTSSLHRHLIDASGGQIISHEKGKEVHFWEKKQHPTPNEIKRYERGFWYLNKAITPTYALDSTRRYAIARKGTALGRILQYNPDAKLIYVTRDPVKLFLSRYKMLKAMQILKKKPSSIAETDDFNSFTEANLNMSSPVFKRGLYGIQIERIKELTNNYLILRLEDFRTPEKIYQQLEDFLGIELNRIAIPKKNSKSEDEVISEFTLSKIREAYKNHPENIYPL